MKKRNLTAVFLACALCAIAVTGAGCAPQGLGVDEAEPVAVTSVADAEPVKMEGDSAIVDDADAKPAQEAEAAPVDAEPMDPEREEGKAASDPKPTVQAASQPQVKKAVQNSAVTPKQQPQTKAKAAVESPEANPGGEEVDDEVLMVIDTVPAVAEAIDAEQPAAKARTITVNGVAIDYVDSFRTSSAPEQDAGLWLGSDSTTDGSFGYFIGHNNTEFGDVANLEQGNVVSVTDSNGDSCDYEVVDSFVVPEGTLWSEVSERVTGYGESIVMQTCVDDGYMIVVAD